MYILGQECREGSQKEMFNPVHWAELLGLSDLQAESLERMVKIEKAFGKCECIFEQIARRVHPCSVAQSCLTLCNPIDCNPPDSSVHGISQAKILECVAISFCRGSFWPRDHTRIPCIGRWILHHWDTWEAQSLYKVDAAPILQMRKLRLRKVR